MAAEPESCVPVHLTEHDLTEIFTALVEMQKSPFVDPLRNERIESALKSVEAGLTELRSNT